MSAERRWATALSVALILDACSDSPRPYGNRTTTPPSSPAARGETPSTPPANTAAPASSAPAGAEFDRADGSARRRVKSVDEKKGNETGMVGGASVAAASGGKPGANMPGTGGAAQTTGEPTTSSR